MGFWKQKEFKLTENDCDLDSEVYVKIHKSIHNTFNELMKQCLPLSSHRPLVKINPPELSEQGDYLSFQLVLDMSDGRPVPERYQEIGTRESMELWERLKPAIVEAAKFEKFDTTVKLMKWGPGSIILIVDIIKNVNSLWTEEEVNTIVERADSTLRQIKFDIPLQYTSIIPANFLKFQIDIISHNEDVIDTVGSLTDSFKRKLLRRAVNGDPSEFFSISL